MGDIPPLPGVVEPRGPFCIPLSISRRPILIVLVWEQLRLRRTPAGFVKTSVMGADVADHATGDESIPNEQNRHCAYRRGNKAGALIRPIPAHRLADPRCEEPAGDAEHRRENEPGWLVWSW